MRRAAVLRDAIEQEIATGAFQPGDRLDEVRLATRFGVSRTPIREALFELSSAGIVDLYPRRGAFVREVSVSELVEMFEVMAELEGMCGRLAARRMDDGERTRLREAHEACRAAAEQGEADQYYYLNEAFHQVIYEGAHNQFLAQEARRLKNRLKVYRRLQLRHRGRIGVSFSEHGEIVEALLAGAEADAEAALKHHILIQGERFTDFVASLKRVGD